MNKIIYFLIDAGYTHIPVQLRLFRMDAPTITHSRFRTPGAC